MAFTCTVLSYYCMKRTIIIELVKYKFLLDRDEIYHYFLLPHNDKILRIQIE